MTTDYSNSVFDYFRNPVAPGVTNPFDTPFNAQQTLAGLTSFLQSSEQPPPGNFVSAPEAYTRGLPMPANAPAGATGLFEGSTGGYTNTAPTQPAISTGAQPSTYAIAPPSNPFAALAAMFGPQPQQPEFRPSGNASADIRTLGGTVPSFVDTLQAGRPVSGPGDIGAELQQFGGFQGMFSPQSIGNLSDSELQFLIGLIESPLVGIPWSDVVGAMFQPYQGLTSAPKARRRR